MCIASSKAAARAAGRRSRRTVRDDGTYQLFLKASDHSVIEKEYDGKDVGINSYHLIQERRGNNSSYRAYCYVNVTVVGVLQAILVKLVGE